MNQILDKIDIKIMRNLQEDGRLANAELAEMVNVSAATCHRRTQRLFKEGFISSVQANINPESVGHGAMVMVGVVLDRTWSVLCLTDQRKKASATLRRQ